VISLVVTDKNEYKIVPGPDDIVIHASAEAEIIDGKKLHEIWKQVVVATHPDYSFVSQAKINPQIFMPLDLDRFLAVRCRAVSGLEKWGPNVNGDGFPSQELASSYLSLMAKGFYVEHQSYDPKNAIGILAHAQWVPEEQYILAVALIDKVRHPREADMIRRSFENRRAGVSIGCIAGTAECSCCHNVARRKQELCSHMDKSRPGFIKGRRQASGAVAFDICRNLTFYELSYTKTPADRDALSLIVSGADEDAASTSPATSTASPLEIKLPDDKMLADMVNKAVQDAFLQPFRKLVKDVVYKELQHEIKKMQIEVKPEIQETVSEKKQELAPALETKLEQVGK